MFVYILKTVACLAIFYVFYKIFLEKENMHIFKRFYLLGALVLSMSIPALVFTEYVEAPAITTTYETVEHLSTTDEVIGVPPTLETDVLDIEPILWTIYFLGLLFFGLKFIRNLFQIFRRIRRNPKHRLNRFTQVLVQEEIPPHTFFSYIFLNKTRFESNEIPKAVVLHEETHAQQKHSWDVVFVESLQVILWINPFVYLIKKSVKLNHEFLADQAVLKKNIDKIAYQNILLSYVSTASEKKYQPQLANAINYSSIKKRFIVMKKHTSKKAVLFRSLLLLPLLTMLIYGFSQRSIEERTTADNNITTIINDINIEIDRNGGLLINNQNVLLTDISEEVNQLNVNLKPYYIRNYVTANILYDENQLELIEKVQEELHYAGISNIIHSSKRTSSILRRDGFKASFYSGKTLDEAKALRREKVLNQIDTIENDEALLEIVWIEIKNENEIWFNYELTELGDLANKIVAAKETTGSKLTVQINSPAILHSDFINEITLEVRKAGAKRIQVFVNQNIIPESEYQDEVSKKLVAEYNTLAKKYNTTISKSKSIQIKLKDVERLEYIYGLMSDKQKSNAEPFPDFPEPPPTPKDPKVKKGMKSDIPQPPTPKKIRLEINEEALQNEINTKDIVIDNGILVKTEYRADYMPRRKHDDLFFGMPKERFSKVKKEQKNDIPKPPSTPDHKEMKERMEIEEIKMLEQETLMEKQEIKMEEQSILMEQQEARMEEQEVLMEKQMVRMQGQVEEMEELMTVMPPKPKSPLNHVIEMAKKNAIFYYEGKEISSDKAIEILKKNNDLNIDSSTTNGERPVVKLSAAPLLIAN